MLGQATGIDEQPRPRLLVGDTRSLPAMGKGTGKAGDFQAVGVRSVATAAADDVAARFDDGSPAVIQRAVGRGRVVHFAWMPGLAYWKSATDKKDGLPAGFSDSIRGWITRPVELAGVRPPVVIDRPLVEAPMLASSAGIAVTLLNWTGEPQPTIRVEVRTDRGISRVESVSRGRLDFEAAAGAIRFALPLDAADVVTLR